jgi:hypothetical protein
MKVATRCQVCKRVHEPHCLQRGDRLTIAGLRLRDGVPIECAPGEETVFEVGDDLGQCVNDAQVLTAGRVNTDRHKPGYMAAYMRDWRKKSKRQGS